MANRFLNKFKQIIGLPAKEEYPNDAQPYQPERRVRTITPETADQQPAREPRREESAEQPRVRGREPARPAYREERYPAEQREPRRRESLEPRYPSNGERRAPSPRRQSSETLVATISTIPETRKLINALVHGYTIVLTIDNDEQRSRERVLDTMCGAVFALDATIKRANGSSTTFVIAPRSAALRSYEEMAGQL